MGKKSIGKKLEVCSLCSIEALSCYLHVGNEEEQENMINQLQALDLD